MARLPRAVATDYPHHITQRGNYKQAIFNDDEDFIVYKEWLDKYSKRYGLSIWAYCLMSNHIHILGVPAKDQRREQVSRRAPAPKYLLNI
jgi:putative transposase